MKYLYTFVLLVVFYISSYSQSCTFHLSGHVEDEDTRDKLQGAVVTIKGLDKKIITDGKGDFVFENLCPGQYTLLVTHINCDSIQKIILLQRHLHIDFLMPHARKTLGEVVVETKIGVQNTGFKKTLSEKMLDATKGLSIAEALSRLNGVTLLQTGSTISKPVIHGLHSGRVLMINNGVRQEGQQWGNEHAPEIDPFIADKLTVIKGVDELKYGSDAIAGVILVEPKSLQNEPGKYAEINSAYFTNNRQYVASATWEQRLKKYPVFAFRIQGTFRKGANAKTPTYRLNNTGSEEKNFSITTGWKKQRLQTELFYSYFSTKLGIFTGSHIGNLTDLKNAIAASKPDDVFLGQNTYVIDRPYQQVTHNLLKSKSVFRWGEHKINLLISGQYNIRKEYDIVRSSTNKKPQLDLSILTISEDLNWEHPKTNGLSGVVGFSSMQQDNSYAGRYFIPNYFSYSFGGYIIEKWNKHKWELQGGLRYDNKSINTRRLKFNGDTINHNFNFSTFASSFNTIFKPSNNWRLNLSISLASRAPYVNELLSDGIHHGTATYEKGDIRLRPEKSVNFFSGINFQNNEKSVDLDLLVYSNTIRDFIYQQPMPDNPVLTIAGAFPLIEYKQTNAVLNGFDVSALVKFMRRFEWQTKFSYLHAKDKTLDDWLILMPANRLSNEISYNFGDHNKRTNTYLSAELLNVFKQTRVPHKNNISDYKAPPPGYSLLNLYASTSLSIKKTPVTFGISARNILNTVYRDYLNSMRYFSDEMGINIGFRVKILLNSNLPPQ